jgi:hypothetical protein
MPFQPMHVTTALVPLLGCGSLKFNLAVQKWISNQPLLEETISKVTTVMKKASTLKVSAQPRKLTYHKVCFVYPKILCSF